MYRVGAIAFVCGLFFGVSCSWSYLSQGYDLKIAEYERQIQDMTLQALENSRNKELEIGRIKNEYETQLHGDVDAVNDYYRKLAADRVHIETDSGGNENMPTASAAGSKAGESKCIRTDGAEFQKLYQEQLIVARDCDIDRKHLNYVIQLYNEMRDVYN